MVSFGVLLSLAALLVLLAVLQYRWSGQVSEAERERMREALEASARQFREEFQGEMARVCAAFQIEPAGPSRTTKDQYIQRYQHWIETATHPQLVANLFLWNLSEDGDSQLLHLNQTSLQFARVSWPPKFEELRRRLPVREDPDRRRSRSPGPPPFGWRMAEEIPALVRALFQPPRMGDSRLLEPRPWGYFVVELNLEYLQAEFFPNLVQRFFGEPDDSPYRVAIVSPSQPPRIIYTSSSQETGKDPRAADIVVGLLEPRPTGPFPPWLARQLDESRRSGMVRIPPAEPEFVIALDLPPRPQRIFLPRLGPSSPDGGWQLVIQHRAGSLEAVVAAHRRRNLGISFGVLLLLAASAVMVFVSTMRARRLAGLQMDFIAGVSHELRTPLAVICSAADNLADGILEAKDQVQHYGELIRGEGSRLSQMVEQILLFASGKVRRAEYELRPVRIAEIVDHVLADTQHMIEAARFSVEKQIEPDLPRVMADPKALRQCLHNLVSNAVKYGGDRRWMGIRARRVDGKRGPEVQVTVEDKGPGIESAELNDIFKPFYRSKSVTAAQIRGTGLGLSLAKSIAETMGGSLDVESVPGKGSAFRLRLSALKQAEQSHNETAG